MSTMKIDSDKYDEIAATLSSAESFAQLMTTEDYNNFNLDIKSRYAYGLQRLLGRISKDLDSITYG